MQTLGKEQISTNFLVYVNHLRDYGSRESYYGRIATCYKTGVQISWKLHIDCETKQAVDFLAVTSRGKAVSCLVGWLLGKSTNPETPCA
jgi:hypothetical protein